MSLTLTISQEDYPQIFKLYKKDRIKKLESIFRTGYDIHYPKFDDSSSIEYHAILQSIDEIKNSSNNNMNSKFSELIESIQKLTGINNNSSKRGEVGENMLEEIFKKRYGDIVYENKAKTPHSGDAWLHLPDKLVLRHPGIQLQVHPHNQLYSHFQMGNNQSQSRCKNCNSHNYLQV